MKKLSSIAGYLVLGIVALMPLDCRKTEKAECSRPVKELPMKDINEVLKANTESIMRQKGVAGLYVGLTSDSAPCIRVMIEKEDSLLRAKIPRALDGFPVEIEVSGPIKPMGK